MGGRKTAKKIIKRKGERPAGLKDGGSGIMGDLHSARVCAGSKKEKGRQKKGWWSARSGQKKWFSLQNGERDALDQVSLTKKGGS